MPVIFVVCSLFIWKVEKAANSIKLLQLYLNVYANLCSYKGAIYGFHLINLTKCSKHSKLKCKSAEFLNQFRHFESKMLQTKNISGIIFFCAVSISIYLAKNEL